MDRELEARGSIEAMQEAVARSASGAVAGILGLQAESVAPEPEGAMVGGGLARAEERRG